VGALCKAVEEQEGNYLLLLMTSRYIVAVCLSIFPFICLSVWCRHLCWTTRRDYWSTCAIS